MLFSCNKNEVYHQIAEIENATWSYDDIKSFEYVVTDTTEIYDLILVPVHTEDFSYQNLYVNIETLFPEGTKTANIVSLNLASNVGGWEGNCSSGYCYPEILLKNKTRFLEGKYIFNISQNSRDENLVGISKLELVVRKSN
jgi:gliding motility-associated lipoprotein GldH